MSAVARTHDRKYIGLSFTAGPDVERTIAPKALDRFKRSLGDHAQPNGLSDLANGVENNPPRFKHEAGVSSVVYEPPPWLFATSTTALDAGIFLPCCAGANDSNQRGSSLRPTRPGP